MAATDTTRQDDPSVAELVRQFSAQTSHLIRDEMRLAQAEMSQKARHAGIGLGLFGGAGLLAFFGTGALVTAAIAALALTSLDVWAAALIVAAALFALAGVAALLGRGETKQASPTPERTVENVKRDVEELKEGRNR
ncbi:phage holin family protein [Jiangella alkaliphila]|uniref:Putative Holin-X, holin superfamily III n=1 Tax=Jiangella alkaliphila TaxID=419479 RepID=A0A1H2I457_9ACTN|nr:phage holin family protein [Jiangella alkaliphila]SDU38932.1 Putative Holin-X, holin superfamily III [Jiangella alkaliphila]